MSDKKEASPIRDGSAFQAIASQLRGLENPSSPIAHPGLERLSQVLLSKDSGEGRPSPLDLAVLIRQALRFREMQTEGSISPRLYVPGGSGWPDHSQWTQVGVEARSEGQGYMIRANPWLPQWLPDSTPRGVDASAVSELRQRIPDIIPGDPFLANFPGHESYLTRGQRSAIRAAFTTPPGGTLLVNLPTGDGKSFVFQLLAEIGYGSNDGLPGVTLVITPTVALALDQQYAAEQLNIAQHRSAYVGGMQSEQRKEMINRIREGTQGLCIASPEAACSTLRDALIAAATNGFLRTIVVDEAHLVDAWGANFRASFQVLSGLWKEMLTSAPQGEEPRTLLLSATLTDATVETLRTLFPGDVSDGPGFRIVSAPQLRPEIDYWVSEDTGFNDRVLRVMEAVLHMPRPAIVYTTEVAHAHQLHNKLRQMGFRRLGLMTGKSSGPERDLVVNDWRANRLDLVVGTSAFGLGIDNQHVRTVIHACVPETLDRFYQEVGRGGRDGCSSTSIIIPAKEPGYRLRDDFDTARGLNSRRFLTVEVALRRWEAMFHNQGSFHEGASQFKLLVDVPPGFDTGYIDMVGEMNTEWNLRTLTLMANTQMIELLGPESSAEPRKDTDLDVQESELELATSFQLFQRVKILEPAHLEVSTWERIVDAHREYMDNAYRENLKSMFLFMQGKQCAADTLAPIYRLNNHLGFEQAPLPDVAKACGGCPYCRSLGSSRETEQPKNATHPWAPVDLQWSPNGKLLDSNNRVLIFYPDEKINQRSKRRLLEALGKLAASGVRNVISIPGAPITPEEIQKSVPNIALFAASALPPWENLPPGPVMMFLPSDYKVSDLLLRPREADDAHFIFLHNETEDPAVSGVPLRTRFNGPQFTDLRLFSTQVK